MVRSKSDFDLSQLTYLFSILPDPPIDLIKKVEKILFKFIWNGKPDEIKRDVIYCKKEMGGLNMTNISHFIDALNIAWFKRLLNVENNGRLLNVENNGRLLNVENNGRLLNVENNGKWKVLFDNKLSKLGAGRMDMVMQTCSYF